jgi:adenosine deaminase
VDDPVFMAEAAKDCTFYLSPTSNIETGVVSPSEIHPGRKMIDAGCKVTIGTDDPATFGTNLRHEYTVAMATMRLTDEEVEQIKMNSVEAAIIPVKHVNVVPSSQLTLLE